MTCTSEVFIHRGHWRNGSGLPSSGLAALLVTNVLFRGAESTQEPPQPPAARDGKDGTPQSPDGKPGENGQHGAKGQDGGKGGNSKRGKGGDGGKGGNGLWGGGKGGDGGDAESVPGSSGKVAAHRVGGRVDLSTEGTQTAWLLHDEKEGISERSSRASAPALEFCRQLMAGPSGPATPSDGLRPWPGPHGRRWASPGPLASAPEA